MGFSLGAMRVWIELGMEYLEVGDQHAFFCRLRSILWIAVVNMAETWVWSAMGLLKDVRQRPGQPLLLIACVTPANDPRSLSQKD